MLWSRDPLVNHLSSLPPLERDLSPLPSWENLVKLMSPKVCFRRFLGRPLVGHRLPLVRVLVPPSGRGRLCLVEDQGPNKKALHLRPPGLGRCQTTAAFYLPSFPHPLPQSSNSTWCSRLPCFTDETPPTADSSPEDASFPYEFFVL